MWINIFMVIILIICVITDLKSRKIYNKVIFPGLLFAFIAHLFFGGWISLYHSFLGLLTGLAILIIPYFLGGMGAGDVKLLALIGALKGSLFVIAASIYMALLGAIIAIIVLLTKKEIFARVKMLIYFGYGKSNGISVPLSRQKVSSSATYPYGIAIAGGTILSLFWKEWIFP